MSLEDLIRTAVKSEKAIIGFKRSIRFIKLNHPKLIVIANNLPKDMRKEIEHNSKMSDAEVKVFEGNSKELGVICGKPFPVAVLVIKG